MPSVVKIKPGDVFGKLVVLARAKREEGMSKKRSWWLLECECGEYHVANSDNLKRGAVTSCGCHKRAVNAEQMRRINRKKGL